MVKVYQQFPSERPATPLLDKIESPSDLRQLKAEQLPELADQLRHYLLYCIGKTGGHFGAGLGVTELTIALHYVFNTPEDRLVWDVGHQTYPHKVLTGRRDELLTIRQQGGLSGFPKRSESEYDTFGVGHSSTSISAALGMAMAAKLQGENRRAVAVMGDGAMTAGMAFEAINHAAYVDDNLLVVLNDNKMSISKNVGGLSTYFAKIWASGFYNSIREGGKRVLKRMPYTKEFVRRTEEYMKSFVAPATIFEELGFYYIGPLDGHDLPLLVDTLDKLKAIKGPVILHVITEKGKGFAPAEADPIGYHALNKIEPSGLKKTASGPKYQQVFGTWLCDRAAVDKRLMAITPAMCEGSGMVEFAEKFPQRFVDVAIAEQHAVTLAAGMACENIKPVVAIYSTFLQRGYDQLVHDVALQNLDVTFALDRAGLVGEDGATHAGAYDISYLRCIPNMVIATPADENETRQLLNSCYLHPGPAAVRYPRGAGPNVEIEKTLHNWPIGKGRLLRSGSGPVILNFGALLANARVAAEQLDAELVDMRFAKPLDCGMLEQYKNSGRLLVTLEENSVAGGAGAAVAEYYAEQGVAVDLLLLGLPDRYIDHAATSAQLREVGLDSDGIIASIEVRQKKSITD
ncbi:1-deoxy-D-xylulose-5-phosphate synthase [Porticoccaceae bacterium]|nr:1-deoxy-D-xylulose-5-phosphate synthase [Porticoccaceae bacterium]